MPTTAAAIQPLRRPRNFIPTSSDGLWRADGVPFLSSLAYPRQAFLPQKELFERVAEDGEATDRHDQQPTRPQTLRPLHGHKVADPCGAHQRRNCREPNGLQEFGVKGDAVSNENRRHKGGRPERGEGATENSRSVQPPAWCDR